MATYYAVRGTDIRTIEADSFVSASEARREWADWWDWEVQEYPPDSMPIEGASWAGLIARLDAVIASSPRVAEQAARTRGMIVWRTDPVLWKDRDSYEELEMWVDMAERYARPVKRAQPDGE